MREWRVEERDLKGVKFYNKMKIVIIWYRNEERKGSIFYKTRDYMVKTT